MMYCPNCAAPIDGVKFCRSCGTNVSLVPQALTGQLPEDVGGKEEGQSPRHGKKSHDPPNIESAMATFFSGLGLVIASVAIMRYLPGGLFWGWIFIMPGVSYLGQGIGHYLRYREYQKLPFRPPIEQPGSGVAQVSAPTTSSLVPPLGITEDTTRQLETSPERK